MKMEPRHYNVIKQRIQKIPKTWVLSHKEKLKDDVRVKDADKRLRWDLFYAITSGASWPEAGRLDFLDELYSYLDDTHIDTALRKIVTETLRSNDHE